MINIMQLCLIKYPGMVETGKIIFQQINPEDRMTIYDWNVPNIPEPSIEELEAEIPQYQHQFDVETFKSDIDRKVNDLLLSTAQSRGYSSVNSIVSYAVSSNAQWKYEADAFVAWRDRVWEHVYIEYMSIDAGASIPNEDEFMSTLPQIVWP